MAESRLVSNPVVEYFDVLRDLALGLFPGGEVTVMNQFSLQGTPAAFHQCIVPAVALATHRSVHAELPQQFLVGVRTVLAAAI